MTSSNQKHAAVSFVERADGRILCVWNRRYGGWSLPGGLVEPNESVTGGMVRELREETGLDAGGWEKMWDRPAPRKHRKGNAGRAGRVHLFRVEGIGTPTEHEIGCPITWLTREEFLKWSPFGEFYRGHLPGPSRGYLWAPPTPVEPAPIPMLLWCPECGERHLDVGAFATKVHHTHACQTCGHCWRPAVVATVGAQFLPGFKNVPNGGGPK